jgi:hypothetical protein
MAAQPIGNPTKPRTVATQPIGNPTKPRSVATQPIGNPSYKVDMFFIIHTLSDGRGNVAGPNISSSIWVIPFQIYYTS